MDDKSYAVAQRAGHTEVLSNHRRRILLLLLLLGSNRLMPNSLAPTAHAIVDRTTDRIPAGRRIRLHYSRPHRLNERSQMCKCARLRRSSPL